MLQKIIKPDNAATTILIRLVVGAVFLSEIIIMFTAISTTKIPILINEGFRNMAHESRTDWAMLLGCSFLLMKGGERWSVDRKITKHRWT